MALFECCRICMLTFFTRCYVMLLADVPYCLLQCSMCLQMIDKFHLCICEWKTFFLIWHLLFQSFIWSINPIFANADMLMLSESCIVPLCRCLFWIFCLHFLSSLIDSPFVFLLFLFSIFRSPLEGLDTVSKDIFTYWQLLSTWESPLLVTVTQKWAS